MDRNSIIGISLIFLILIGFSYFNQPSETELSERKREQDSVELLKKQVDSAYQSTAVVKESEPELNDTSTSHLNSRYGSFGQYLKGTEETATLENDLMKVTLSTKGGTIRSVELKKYKRADKSPLILFDKKENEFGFDFQSRDTILNTGDLYFTPDQKSINVASGKSGKLTMLLDLGDNKSIEQEYVLYGDSFIVGYNLKLNGLDKEIPANINYLDLKWKLNVPLQEKDIESERTKTTVYFRFRGDEEVDYLSETESESEKFQGDLHWISFKQQFFNSTLIAEPNTFTSSNYEFETELNKNSQYVKTLRADLLFPYKHDPKTVYNLKFFFGPNHFNTLKTADIDLEKIVPLGWGIFGWVNRFAVIPIFNFLNQYISSYGIIILLLTIIIKVVLFPFVYKSYVSTVKMRLLKPEMDEIKEKCGDDLQKMQMENMKLYKKAGVSPLGGCLPLLFQMPILIAMFTFFPSSFELRQEPFLWATDLSTYDSILDLPFKIPFYGDHVSLFTLLMTVSTLLYTHFNNQLSGITGQMKWMGYLMPIIFLGVFNSYSSGLSYYYFLSNVITFGQQAMIRQFVDEKALHATIQENKKKPDNQKKSKFQMRLEEMAKTKGIDPKRLKK